MANAARMVAGVMEGAVAAAGRGAGDAGSGGVASAKVLLGRGCDPVMAAHSLRMLPPLLGGAQLVVTTDDDEFIARLRERKYDAVFFAPGACRWDAARAPIPGGNAATCGWGLEKYRALVRETQGAAVPIVESTEEREMVPLLRAALGLK